MRAAVQVLLLAGAVLAPAESLDWQVQRLVQSARAPGLERPMQVATRVGRPVIVAGALLAVGLLDRAQGVTTLKAAALALIPTNLVVEALKWTTDRARPDGQHRRSNASFPSSHAANAFAIAWVLARRWRSASVGLFVSAALVAYSRMYLNRHFMSDVVVGALIGVAFGWMATRWLERPRHRAPPGRQREPAASP